jgi:hypothetical protein
MNVEKYNKPMAAVLGMNKTDFHVIKLHQGEQRYSLYSFLASVLDGSEWSE